MITFFQKMQLARKAEWIRLCQIMLYRETGIISHEKVLSIEFGTSEPLLADYPEIRLEQQQHVGDLRNRESAKFRSATAVAAEEISRQAAWLVAASLPEEVERGLLVRGAPPEAAAAAAQGVSDLMLAFLALPADTSLPQEMQQQLESAARSLISQGYTANACNYNADLEIRRAIAAAGSGG